jgi:hypothetical protein
LTLDSSGGSNQEKEIINNIKIEKIMKKILSVLFVLSMLTLTGCEGFNQPNNGGSNQQQDEYYVKYSIDVTGPYQHFWKISYADVDGMKTSNEGNSVKHWTVTIGPVKKGFRASVKNAMGTGMNKIEVSKNNGPFTLKASGEDSATYTIAF